MFLLSVSLAHSEGSGLPSAAPSLGTNHRVSLLLTEYQVTVTQHLVAAVPPGLILSPSSNLAPIFYPSFDNWVFLFFLVTKHLSFSRQFTQGSLSLNLGLRTKVFLFWLSLVFVCFYWKRPPLALCKPCSISKTLQIPSPSSNTHASCLNFLSFPLDPQVFGDFLRFPLLTPEGKGFSESHREVKGFWLVDLRPSLFILER